MQLAKALKKVWIIYSLLALLVLLAAVFIPNEVILNNTPTCYSVKQFGKECFMCGSTRSFVMAGSGNFEAAASMNKMALALFMLIIINSLILLYFFITNLTKNK